MQTVIIKDLIDALEGGAGNTDTDPRWLAASYLRELTDMGIYFVDTKSRAGEKNEDGKKELRGQGNDTALHKD